MRSKKPSFPTTIGSPIQEARLIISIKEARKILGSRTSSMSDDQIANLILVLTDTAERFLQNKGSKVE